MRKFLLLFFIPVLISSADERAFGYGDIHMMAGYPMVGVGIRSHKGANGYDFSGSLFPYFTDISRLLFHLKGLYHFHPKGGGFYFGSGLGLLNEPETMGLSGSFEAAAGFQWRTRGGQVFFLQADAIAPFSKAIRREIVDGQLRVREERAIWPGTTFGFGF